MLFRWNVRMVVTASMMLASCGARTTTDSNPTAALAAGISEQCSKLQKPELGAGTVCFDSGFRIASDDFSFTNWGRSNNADSNVTVQTLIDLFGHSSICMPGATTACVMRPSTIQQLEQWNNALSGGRCEGIATLASRLFLKYDRPDDFAPGVQKAADLKVTDGTLAQDIVFPLRARMKTYPGDCGSREAIVSTRCVEASPLQNGHVNGPIRAEMGTNSNVPVVPSQSMGVPSSAFNAWGKCHVLLVLSTRTSLRTPGLLLSYT